MKNKLLVVEDDPGYLALLAMRLEKAGFAVSTAEGGEEAKKRFSESPTPVVITDLAMPKVDGINLLKFIKARRPDTAVILLTGKGSIEKAVQAMREGATDFLIKPVSEDKLVSLVRHCFEGRRFSRGTAGQEAGEAPGFETQLTSYDLTKSEIRIVERVLQGKTDQEIADTICVSYHTVKKHLQNIFKKTQVRNRIDLIIQFK